MLFTASWDKMIRCIDLEQNKVVKSFIASKEAIKCMQISDSHIFSFFLDDGISNSSDFLNLSCFFFPQLELVEVAVRRLARRARQRGVKPLQIGARNLKCRQWPNSKLPRRARALASGCRLDQSRILGTWAAAARTLTGATSSIEARLRRLYREFRVSELCQPELAPASSTARVAHPRTRCGCRERHAA